MQLIESTEYKNNIKLILQNDITVKLGIVVGLLLRLFPRAEVPSFLSRLQTPLKVRLISAQTHLRPYLSETTNEPHPELFLNKAKTNSFGL